MYKLNMLFFFICKAKDNPCETLTEEEKDLPDATTSKDQFFVQMYRSSKNFKSFYFMFDFFMLLVVCISVIQVSCEYLYCIILMQAVM